jgi:putative sterol carrier protein
VAIEATEGRSRRRWLLEIVKGDVTVSRKAGGADVTLRAPEDVLRAIVTGRTSPTAAVLRGTVEVEGNPRLLVLFRRMLPGPPRGRRRG